MNSILHAIERRRHDRYRLSPMYTSVTARDGDGIGADQAGHVYDISEGGVRIELDEPVEVGQFLALDLELPGMDDPVCATGDVVWVNDSQDDPGPRRMALRFRRFETTADRIRLMEYLGHGSLSAAA